MVDVRKAEIFVEAMKARYRDPRQRSKVFFLPESITDENLISIALAGSAFTHDYLPQAISMGARRLVYQVTYKTVAKISSFAPDELQVRVCEGLKKMGLPEIYWRNCQISTFKDDCGDLYLAFDHSTLLVGETVPELMIGRLGDGTFMQCVNE